MVYDRTYQKTENGVVVLPAPEETSDYLSKRFAWLPSDFAVDADGKVSLQSSYMQVPSPFLLEDQSNMRSEETIYTRVTKSYTVSSAN